MIQKLSRNGEELVWALLIPASARTADVTAMVGNEVTARVVNGIATRVTKSATITSNVNSVTKQRHE